MYRRTQQSSNQRSAGFSDLFYSLRTDGRGELSTEEELSAGAARPAVCEPSPNFCSVRASSFPVGFSPWASWNLLTASVVELSHLPVAVPVNDPSFANACCISAIRSGVGTFCPRDPRRTPLVPVLEVRRLLRLEADAARDLAFLAVAGLAHRPKVSAISKPNPAHFPVRLCMPPLFSRAVRPCQQPYCLLLLTGTTPEKYMVKVRSVSLRPNTLNTTLSPGFSLDMAPR